MKCNGGTRQRQGSPVPSRSRRTPSSAHPSRPNGKEIAVGAADNTVRLIDAATGKELQKIGNHENWVLGTVFGIDGKRVVSVGRDRAAKLSDVASGAFLENVNLLRGELAAVARHPAKDIVVIGGEDRIPYIYLMDRPKVMKIADDTTLIRKLAAAGWRHRRPRLVLRWQDDRGGRHGAAGEYLRRRYRRARSLRAKDTAPAFTPSRSARQANRLATGGFDGHVRIYNPASRRTVERSSCPCRYRRKCRVRSNEP